MSIGIDYGLGRTNIDTVTGIRYGCISVHAITQAWYDSAEADYGKPHCPRCGNEAQTTQSHTRQDADGVTIVVDIPEAWAEWERQGCADYACESCQYLFDGDQAFGDEPSGYGLNDGEYIAVSCLDADVMVIRSPYFTYGPYCSPCVPGAVTLDADGAYSAEQGIKAYCFGHDWFDDGKAPYKVYRVDDGSEVLPDVDPIDQVRR